MTGGNQPALPSPPDFDEGETPASGGIAGATPYTSQDLSLAEGMADNLLLSTLQATNLQAVDLAETETSANALLSVAEKMDSAALSTGTSAASTPVNPPATDETAGESGTSTGHPKKTEAKVFAPYEGRTIISNQGRISFLMMPNKFVLSMQNETEFYTLYEYEIPNYDGMKIGHWDWTKPGSQFSNEVAANFKAILELEPHVLDDDEMIVLEDVVPQEVFGYNGAFDLIALRTEDINGTTVLVLEVKWWDVDRKAYGVFFPSDESWQFLESVHFEGREIDFRQTFLSAKASFLRMRWRS